MKNWIKENFEDVTYCIVTTIGAVLMLILLGTVQPAYSQDVVRQGNTFKSVSKSIKAVKDTLATAFTFEDNSGNIYPIIVNKGSGRCYIWKVSGKTGRYYKMYMKPEISKAICKELGIDYIEKN